MSKMRPGQRNAFGEVVYSPLEFLCRQEFRDTLCTTLARSFRELGMDVESEHRILAALFSVSLSDRLDQVEEDLRNIIRQFVDPSALGGALARRASLVARQISEFIIGDRLCDIGAGDGLIPYFLGKQLEDVVLVDVKDYRDTRAEFRFFLSEEGKPLPVFQRVDTSLLLTVLHHAQDPVHLLREARRITKHRVIVIESVVGVNCEKGSTSSWLCLLSRQDQLKYASFFDWLYNRVLHEDVVVPYNYTTPEIWRQTFERNGFSIEAVLDLGIDQPLVPEHHVLVVLNCAEEK